MADNIPGQVIDSPDVPCSPHNISSPVNNNNPINTALNATQQQQTPYQHPHQPAENYYSGPTGQWQHTTQEHSYNYSNNVSPGNYNYYNNNSPPSSPPRGGFGQNEHLTRAGESSPGYNYPQCNPASHSVRSVQTGHGLYNPFLRRCPDSRSSRGSRRRSSAQSASILRRHSGGSAMSSLLGSAGGQGGISVGGISRIHGGDRGEGGDGFSSTEPPSELVGGGFGELGYPGGIRVSADQEQQYNWDDAQRLSNGAAGSSYQGHNQGYNNQWRPTDYTEHSAYSAHSGGQGSGHGYGSYQNNYQGYGGGGPSYGHNSKNS